MQADIARLKSTLNADLTKEREEQSRQAVALEKLIKLAGGESKK